MRSLCQRLKNLTRNKKTLFLGVGNALKGDDAAGISLVDELSRLNFPADRGVGFLNCGVSPENYLEKIKALSPQAVVIADAAENGKRPGTLELMDLGKADNFSLSTHSLSFEYLKEYLQELKCEFFLLAIQPKTCKLGAELSREVKCSIEAFVSVFKF